MSSAAFASTDSTTLSTATFPPGAVRLLDSDFRRAQDTSVRYLLELDADRLLAPYRREAGLEALAPPYGSWESDGMGGHIGGHYLSACARLYAATGDPRLMERLEYVVGELARCQSPASGFVGGVPRGEALGAELGDRRVDADLFTLNGRWVPLYNLHKCLAGLLDAHTYTGSGAALDVARRLGDWWLEVSRALSDELFEEMLHTEFGGMQEAFTLLAAATGNEAYLEAARRFTHRSVFDPLAEGRDELDGLHANTQIPKVVGYAEFGSVSGDARYLRAADQFWDTVVSHRTVSIGGNSVREHFQPSADFTPMIQDPQGPETCNTYNMLKLAKLRFERVGDPAAIDFYERASYNHILSSQHPGHGGLVYFTSMRPAHYRVYSRVQESMWCCVGSGLENHARYGELVYSHRGDDLLVNLYLPSELSWKERGLSVRLVTDFPRSDTIDLHVSAAQRLETVLRLRRPSWAHEMTIDVDGARIDAAADDDGYVPVARVGEGTTHVRVRFGVRLQAEQLPDGSPWISYRFGPVVLAARAGDEGVDAFQALDERMGHVAAGRLLPLAATPVIAAADPLAAVVLEDRTRLRAKVRVVVGGKLRTLLLEPFAGIHDERYTVYWPTGPVADRIVELAALDHAAAAHARVVDAVDAGEQQPESDHAFRGEATRAGQSDGVHWRSATGWFSYNLLDPEHRAVFLRVTFQGLGGYGHELRLNGVPVGDEHRCVTDGDATTTDFAVDDTMRAAGQSGLLVFSVHAIPGAHTGNLVTVQLLAAAPC